MRALLKGGDDSASQGKLILKFGRRWGTLCDASSGVGQCSTELREYGDALLEYRQLIDGQRQGLLQCGSG